MLYLHDVWVNWFSEEQSYNVPYYHEWRKDDNMQLLDQVPVLIVKTELMNQIENSFSKLPPSLLNKIESKAFIRRGSKREMIDFCCIVSDGNRTMAIDTLGSERPVNKSRIMPQHELIVHEMADCHPAESFKLEPYEGLGFSLSKPDPAWFNGLTRRERKLKQVLLLAVNEMIKRDNELEIRYWAGEFVPGWDNLMSKENIIDHLTYRLFYGWNEKHMELCTALIKGNKKLERIFGEENKIVLN